MRTCISLVILCLSLPYLAISQYQDLLKNSDITWIAEFEMDLSFNLEQSGENTNKVTPKKSLQTKGVAGDSRDLIAEFMYDHITNGEVLAYETSSLLMPFGFDQILDKVSSYDTITNVDPATSEEKEQIVKNEFDHSSLKTCRTKQALYFNGKTNSLGTYLIAIAPLMEISRPDESPMQKEPLGWIKMDDLPNNVYSENLSAVTWAATIETNATPLDFSKLKVVKGGLDFRKFLYDNAINGSHQVEDGRSGYGSSHFITKQEIEKVYTNRIDSVITFDPATYTDNVEIVMSNFKPTQINNCYLVQDWFYIPEKKLLTNRLKAITPIIPVIDYKGQIRYYQPLYYIRY